MIAAGKREAERKQAEKRALQEMERQNMMSLKYQMENRKELEQEARKQYLKEKAVVDRQVEQLREQEMSKIVAEQ